MRVNCPHCHNPIEIVERPAREEVVCPSCGSSFNFDPHATERFEPEEHSRRIGRFELLEELGVGAFGTVYKARDTQLDRTVALKVPRAGHLTTPAAVDRFIREARAAAQLKHSSIVSVHDAGQVNGLCYLVSEYVSGASLADRLTAGTFSFTEAAELMAQVADALDYAHGQGVIHRDMKPSNIMLDLNGRPHILDFGLAKRDAGEITMTIDGQILGTPAYMSPEQARGEGHSVDGRTDVYSLGVILYELLTGDLPFRGNSRMLLVQVQTDEPCPPRRLNDHIPRDLETITLKCLAKEPDRRYASAAALSSDLQRWLRGEPILARPVSRTEKSWRWVKRNLRIAMLGTAVMVLLSIVVIGLPIGYLLATNLYSYWRNERLPQAIQASRESEARGHLSFGLHKLMEALEVAEDGDPLRPRALAEMGRLASGMGICLPHSSLVMCVALSPDGKTVVTGCEDNTARLWDAATGEPLGKALRHDGPVRSVAFSPDGASIATGSNDKTARIWDAVRCEPQSPPLRHQISVLSVEFLSDGEVLLTDDTNLHLWNIRTAQPIELPSSSKLLAAAVSPDRKTLFTGDVAGVRQWDLDTREPKGLPLPHQGVRNVAFSADGQTILISGSGAARLWDATTLQPHGEPMPHVASTWHAILTHDGRTALTSIDAKTVRFWNVSTGEPQGHVLRHESPIHIAAFNRNGDTLVTCAKHMTYLWDAATGEPIASPAHHTGDVVAAALSSDGKLVITGSHDRTAQIWPVRSDADDKVPRPFPDDMERVRLWVEVQTGMAGHERLRIEDWHARRKRLKELGGMPIPWR